MKKAILCFSPQGSAIANRFFSSDDRYGKDFENSAKKEDFARIFFDYPCIVFIGAVGIAVRYIAPYVEDKRTDPAVIVVDPSGRYVIPILSGHLGGANEISLEIAETLGAEAILTTASDRLGFESIDLFAKKNHYAIASMERMRKIASAMVAGREILFYSKKKPRPDYEKIRVASSVDEADREGGVVVSNRRLFLKKALQLIPRTVHLGVGSKKGTEAEPLFALIEASFKACGIDPRALAAVHTIDLKKEEESIRTVCSKLNVPLFFYKASELARYEGRCSGSAFVKKTVGVASVSCPAALMGGDKIRVEKVRNAGFTITLTEEGS